MVAAILLAAGASSRFGSQKLLAPLRGEPVVRRAAERVCVAHLDDVIAVLGRDANEVGQALAGLPLRTIVNAQWADGMSTSLRAGVAALAAETDAVIIALGDQPFIPSGVIERLVEVHRERRPAIVAPLYEGARGHPVLFDRSMFGELLAVSGDEGARAVIARDSARVTTVECAHPMPRDVDTTDDLDRVQREFGLGDA